MSPDDARLLVVDDVDASRFIKVQMLRRAGFTVAEASTGTEALAYARAMRPDIVVLDVNLPDISGFDVCRQLKQDAGVPAVQDRKSTRLNSSHMSISHAVFCLKKKNLGQ